VSFVRRMGMSAGLLLLAGYAVPLFFPPQVAWPILPGAEDELLQRLFPGIPRWWIVGRLAGLVVGAALVAGSVRFPLPLRLDAEGGVPPGDDSTGSPASRALAIVALGLAVGHVLSGPYARGFGRPGQTAYLLFLGVPALVLAMTERDRMRRALRALLEWLPRLLVMPAAWLAWTIPVSWRSPRAATIVDGWMAIERLEQVVGGSQGLMDSAIPGFPNAHMLFEGAPFYGPDDAARLFGSVQGAHFFWTAVCAVAVGVLVRQLIGPAAAVIGQAVFLFSPLMMSTPYSPQPIYLMPLCSVAVLLLLLALHRHRSVTALAALGAVAGFSGQIAQHALATAFACLLAAYSIRQWPRRPWIAIAVALLVCAAAVLPWLPSIETFRTMASEYTGGHGQYVGMEQVLFGQVSPLHAREALRAGTPTWLDVPLGALLSPFAIVRTPLRLWGDALFDPVGEILIAVGLACCLRSSYRNGTALLVLGALVAGMALAFSSAGDRVSHTRLLAAIVPLVVLAALGFEALRRSGGRGLSGKPFALAVVGSVAIGGVLLFDRVTPRILPSSFLAIALEALGDDDSERATVLMAPVEFLHTRRIATQLPARPVRVVDFQRFSPERAATDVASPIYLWSPALEAYSGYRAKFCDQWPKTQLFELEDPSTLTRAFAATPSGATWTPRLRARRWTQQACDQAGASPQPERRPSPSPRGSLS